MSQNSSHAVMSQRAEPNDSLDHFPTPPWATRALCEHVVNIGGRTVWEPACGAGHMVKPLSEYAAVIASDAHDYGAGFTVHDFLQPFLPFETKRAIDWIITNPPFRLGEAFVHRALEIADCGVAMLVRSVFIESVGRYEGLYRRTPPSIMAQFVERVPMVKGRLDRTASTATSYCWLVWRKPRSVYDQSRLTWIPPCRAKLEREGDYV